MELKSLEMGLGSPGTRSGASADQYLNGGNLQIEDREAMAPGDLGGVSKGS
jgi:hypothetical protein